MLMMFVITGEKDSVYVEVIAMDFKIKQKGHIKPIGLNFNLSNPYSYKEFLPKKGEYEAI